MPPNSRIIPYEQTNSVIVTDTGSNISKLSKMLDILDVEGYDAGIEVIPVKFASAAELSKLIDTLIPGTTAPPGGAPGLPRFGGAAGGGRFNARRTKEGGIINTIIADERTNTLIVHANSKGADQVRELVAKLDQKLPSTVGGGRVHVVYLQFADAEQISTTLNNLSQQSGAARPTGSGTGVNPVTQSLFEGAIKISPDKATNSLVITASPSDFVTIQRVINRLDIPRDQVYVEVVIMEVQLGNSFDFSANIVSAPSLAGSVTKFEDLAGLLTGNPFGSNGGILSFKAGAPYNYVTPQGQTVAISSVVGLVKLLQANTNSNVLATPQIIALDNSEATFESSDKIPTLGGTTAIGNGLSQSSIVKEPVILSIKIKPQINKLANFVKMDVTAKLGDINNTQVPTQLAGQTFATQDRTAQTTVVVGDSDTIVLGGLIRDDISESVRKVPILGDIPVLGWLFKSRTTAATKRNLLIFMTPHIVKQYEKVRAILDRKLKERDDFIENFGAGKDHLRYVRDNIIRSLPDINELSQKVPQRTFTIDEEKAPAQTSTTTPGAQLVTPTVPGAIGTSPGAPANPAPAFIPEDRIPTDPQTTPVNPSNPEVPDPPLPQANGDSAPQPAPEPVPEAQPAPEANIPPVAPPPEYNPGSGG